MPSKERKERYECTSVTKTRDFILFFKKKNKTSNNNVS